MLLGPSATLFRSRLKNSMRVILPPAETTLLRQITVTLPTPESPHETEDAKTRRPKPGSTTIVEVEVDPD